MEVNIPKQEHWERQGDGASPRSSAPTGESSGAARAPGGIPCPAQPAALRSALLRPTGSVSHQRRDGSGSGVLRPHRGAAQGRLLGADVGNPLSSPALPVGAKLFLCRH